MLEMCIHAHVSADGWDKLEKQILFVQLPWGYSPPPPYFPRTSIIMADIKLPHHREADGLGCGCCSLWSSPEFLDQPCYSSLTVPWAVTLESAISSLPWETVDSGILASLQTGILDSVNKPLKE